MCNDKGAIPLPSRLSSGSASGEESFPQSHKGALGLGHPNNSGDLREGILSAQSSSPRRGNRYPWCPTGSPAGLFKNADTRNLGKIDKIQ